MNELHAHALVVLELVRGVEPLERVDHDTQRDRGRNAIALARGARQNTREGVALHVFHHEVVADGTRSYLEDRNDVGMMDARGESSLVEEHLDELLLVLQVRVQALHRDETLEAADA